MSKVMYRQYVIVMILLFSLGCQSTPNVTRIGDVKELLITEQLSRADVTVDPGDEVRWINKRTDSVRIIFLESLDGKLSCKQGFRGFMQPTESAILDPGESASMCFNDPGSIRYAIKMNSTTPSEDTHVQGLIRIGASLSKDTGASPAPAAIFGQSGSGP